MNTKEEIKQLKKQIQELQSWALHHKCTCNHVCQIPPYQPIVISCSKCHCYPCICYKSLPVTYMSKEVN